jgi:hypothetical protein
LDILYGGLGIGKLQFLIKKKFNFFSAVIFFQFWSSKPWIRIGLQPQTLDPDPEKMNMDPTLEKSIDFQGPPLPLAIEIDLSASKLLHPAPYKQKVPGTLIVKFLLFVS